MARKLVLVGAVAIAAFYLIASPRHAAGAVTDAGSFVGHTGHQLATFLRELG
jgi:hypothetical protein